MSFGRVFEGSASSGEYYYYTEKSVESYREKKLECGLNSSEDILFKYSTETLDLMRILVNLFNTGDDFIRSMIIKTPNFEKNIKDYAKTQGVPEADALPVDWLLELLKGEK